MILWVFLAAFALGGCSIEPLEEPSEPAVEEGGKVTINGSLSLPAVEDQVWTKSFGEYGTSLGQTNISHLYVAVFNEGDILIEIAEARPGTKEQPKANFTPTGSDNRTLFHVTLTQSNNRTRILHFIGTTVRRDELLSANIVDESTYVKTLVTSGGEDAYWSRKEFSSITEDMETMRDIPMVRNFLKVKVESVSDKFSITSFKVFNVPSAGTIAPFNPNSPEYEGSGATIKPNFNRFADYSSPGLTYQSMSSARPAGQGYNGFMPTGVTFDASFGVGDFIPDGGADYLYEATHVNSENNPFIIIKGSYDGHADTYYKADFVYRDESGDTQPYHLLRNFLYTLSISSVTADGFATLQEAIDGVAVNNFESSTLSQRLTNVSDGNTRLFLSTTDELVTYGTSLEMYIKSIKKNGSTWENDNANLSVKTVTRMSGESDLVAYTTSGSEKNWTITIGGSDVTYNGENNWRKVTISLKDPSSLEPGEVLKQSVTFKNKGSDGQDGTIDQKADDLSRNLNLTMRSPMPLTVDVQDFVEGVAGSRCRVDFSIPTGLTEYRFPMYFFIEQEENTLYPEYLAPGADEVLSVMTGKSNIPGQTAKNAYYYRRTITWEEYQNTVDSKEGIKTFSSYFRSLVGESATTVWVFPSPENNYYYTQVAGGYTNQDTFSNSRADGAITFERSFVLLSLAGDSVTGLNRATANSGAPISFTSSDPSVVTVGVNSGILTAVSVGSATITASCGEYGAYTGATATFSVSVVAEGGLDIEWTTEPTRILIPGTTGTAAATVILGTNTSQSGSTEYSSSNTSVATIASNGTITATGAGTTVIKATARATIGGAEGTFEQDISYTLTVAAVGDISIGTPYHTESFTDGTLGDYTIDYESTGPGTYYDETGWHTWYANGQYGATSSSWITTDTPNAGDGYWTNSTSWLISKSIDLRATDGAAIRFTHTANYFDQSLPTSVLEQMQYCLTVWYSIDGGNTWYNVEVPPAQYPTGTSWASQDAVVLLPSAVNGQPNVKIAFKYISDATTGNLQSGFHGQWQVKDVSIIEQ